ncbi:MAG: NADH-quinone oxidoreductase subunit NuoE [Planctomycetota bacterium]|nr:NADH-quinone oxidoreductase subunit NuoE [Planctomycetota bacterium]
MTVTIKDAIDLAPAERILERPGPVRDTDLIPLLQELQDAYGYLPAPVLMEVSRRTGIPASRMYGVITFYSQFHLKPHGRYTIRSCRGTACHVRGGKVVADAIVRHLGVGEGETTPDGLFTFETVACLGCCFLAPAMMIGGDYYGLLTAEKIQSILGRYSAT